LVRNWADTELIAPAGRRENPLLRELGLGDRFVVQYAGNMGPVHDIPMIVDAAAALQQTHPEVHFLFIGSGSRLPWLRSEISRLGLKNITILGPQPRDAQANFLNACDVAITAFVPGMYGAGVPSRMYNVMAAGKPWIAAVDSTSEIGLVIQEENAGWVVAPRDTPNLIAAIVAAF
jgi:glycosyltransferase involved in cell wall biosynthesis